MNGYDKNIINEEKNVCLILINVMWEEHDIRNGVLRTVQFKKGIWE